jgi:hypothetical protein
LRQVGANVFRASHPWESKIGTRRRRQRGAFQDGVLITRSKGSYSNNYYLTIITVLMRLWRVDCTLTCVPPDLEILVDEASAWLAKGVNAPERDGTAAAMIDRLRIAPPHYSEAPCWRDLLALNLRARLADLIAAHRDAHALRDQLHAPSARPISASSRLPASTGGRAL